MKPTVDIISLGGTITMTPGSSGAGAVSTLSAEDLISAVPQIAEIANIRAETFRSIPSAEISFEDLEPLSEDHSHS